jgi:hypothetical protein
MAPHPLPGLLSDRFRRRLRTVTAYMHAAPGSADCFRRLFSRLRSAFSLVPIGTKLFLATAEKFPGLALPFTTGDEMVVLQIVRGATGGARLLIINTGEVDPISQTGLPLPQIAQSRLHTTTAGPVLALFLPNAPSPPRAASFYPASGREAAPTPLNSQSSDAKRPGLLTS